MLQCLRMNIDVKTFKNTDKLYSPDAQQIAYKYAGVVVYNGEGKHNAWSEEAEEGRSFCDYLQICGKKYFVKYPTLGATRNINKTFNELFISYLAGKLGLPCIDSKICIDKQLGAIGVISSHIGKHYLVSDLCVSMYKYCTYSVEKIVDEIVQNVEHRYVCEGDFLVDKENLTYWLKVLSCFDFLTSQNDRHCGNMAVSVTSKDGRGVITFAPILDNEDAFNLYDLYYPTYQLVPTSGEYGISQRELISTDENFNKFYKNFKRLVGEHNFAKTIAEFESIYGLGKICQLAGKGGKYSQIIKDVKSLIQNKIEYVDGYQNAKQ